MTARALLPAAWLLGAAAALPALFLDSWEARRFLFFYTAPLVPAIVLWLRERVLLQATLSRAALGLDALVFTLAALRTVTGALPWSGHMLFLSYAVLTVRSRMLRLLIAALWLLTGWFKLHVWGDFHTWATGLGLGVALAAVRLYAAPARQETVGA